MIESFWCGFEKNAEEKALYRPKTSTRPGKKYMVYVKGDSGNPKLIHFGATGYKHNYSEEAKKNFRSRHNCEGASKDSPKWWACNYLWGKNQTVGTKTNKDLVKRAFLKEFLKTAEALRKEVSTIAVIKDGKMLMGKRRDNEKYTSPGGHLDPGEKPLDGAVRELREESGIEAKPSDLRYLRTIKNPENGYIVHGYEYRLKKDTTTSMKNDPDGEVYRWHFMDVDKIEDKDLHVPRNKGNVLLS